LPYSNRDSCSGRVLQERKRQAEDFAENLSEADYVIALLLYKLFPTSVIRNTAPLGTS